MVYIVSGTGLFYTKEDDVKREDIHYSPNSLFLIPPNTAHCFTIHTYSKYVFIRFTDHYVIDYIGKHIEQALYASNQILHITLNEQDAKMLHSLIVLIETEFSGKRNFSNYLQQQWLNSILVIIARNLMQNFSIMQPYSDETDKAAYMLQYIQQHINHPERLKIETLCETFHLSANYIGRYFKRHFQEDLQHYIARNRIKMVENLLLNSKMSVKEIAYKMGYADSCYLIKMFQKYYGISPLQYRKKEQGNIKISNE